MISSRTGGLLDKASLLPEEEVLYDRVSAMLESFKNDILYRILGGNMPELKAVSPAAAGTGITPAPAAGGAANRGLCR